VALDLAKLGVTRVRPLAGGFPEWRRRGFAVEPAAKAPSAQTTGNA
jgi:3-mercaptopyruvate sulfurtransferase SseA